MDKDKIQGALILGLAAIVLILMKDRKQNPPASAKTYVMEPGKQSSPSVIGGPNVNVSAQALCPSYY